MFGIFSDPRYEATSVFDTMLTEGHHHSWRSYFCVCRSSVRSQRIARRRNNSRRTVVELVQNLVKDRSCFPHEETEHALCGLLSYAKKFVSILLPASLSKWLLGILLLGITTTPPSGTAPFKRHLVIMKFPSSLTLLQLVPPKALTAPYPEA